MLEVKSMLQEESVLMEAALVDQIALVEVAKECRLWRCLEKIRSLRWFLPRHRTVACWMENLGQVYKTAGYGGLCRIDS